MITVAIQLDQLICYRCGITYAIPEAWARSRMKKQRPIHCPRGHRQFYRIAGGGTDPEALKAENEHLRRAVVQAKHEAEQAEARATEAGAPPKADGPSRPVSMDDCRNDAGQYVCPDCGKVYVQTIRLARHLRRIHRVEPSTMQPMGQQEA